MVEVGVAYSPIEITADILRNIPTVSSFSELDEFLVRQAFSGYRHAIIKYQDFPNIEWFTNAGFGVEVINETTLKVFW